MDDIYCSSFISQCSHSVAQGHQISQSVFVHCETMLAISNDLHVIHMLWHSFQKNPFHCDLTSDKGKADLWVVPWLPLFMLFRNGCDWFFLFSYWWHDLTAMTFLYYGKWLSDYICQFLQDLWVFLIGSHGLVYVQVSQMVTNLVFYNGWDHSPRTCLETQVLEWEEKLPVKIEAKMLLSFFHDSCHKIPSHLPEGYNFFFSPFLIIHTEALIILHIPCQI